MDIKSIQDALTSGGFYSGAIDGYAGPMTRAAVDAALEDARLNVGWKRWSARRRRVAFMQAHFRTLDIETGIVDGFTGPQTLYAFEIWQHMERTGARKPEPWRDHVPVPPRMPSVANDWPRQSGASRFYGHVGRHQSKLALPYPMKLAWNKRQIVRSITVHEKVNASAARVFARIASHYSPEDIARHGFNLFAGSLNVRRMRGGTAWSMHSWGIAIDFDSERNQYRWGRDKAYLDAPECEQFWMFWEAEGWLSLGRARNFDWMHVQAARL